MVLQPLAGGVDVGHRIGHMAEVAAAGVDLGVMVPGQLDLGIVVAGGGQDSASSKPKGVNAGVVYSQDSGTVEIDAADEGIQGAFVTVSGGTLTIEWTADDHILMTGPATLAYRGDVDLAALVA